MNDDILLYDEPISEDYEVLKTDPVIVNDIDRIIEDSKKESISNNFIVGDSLYERQQIDQSNDVILLNNVNNNRSSSQNFNLENYDVTDIWINSNPSSSFQAQYLDLNDNIENYDLIGFEYVNYRNNDIRSVLLLKSSDLITFSGSTNNRLGLVSEYNGLVYCRYITCMSNNRLYIDTAFRLYSTATDTSISVPLRIYGLKASTLSNNDIPNQIVSGNNIYNFNYFCGVSENTVSNDIIHKPISEYNTIESLGLYSFMIALGIGFYLLIRRAVFKWR